MALGIVEAIIPVKSPGDLATLLDTPGLPATFLLAKERTPSKSESHLGTAKASTLRSSKSAQLPQVVVDTFLKDLVFVVSCKLYSMTETFHVCV